MEIETVEEFPASVLCEHQLPLRLPPKSHKCPVCSALFLTRKELDVHKVTAHEFVRCRAKRCAKVFMSESRREIHYARCHRGASEERPPPTVPITAKPLPSEQQEQGTIQNLHGITMNYLQDIQNLAITNGLLEPQKVQSFVTCILNELAGSSSPHPSFFVHAIRVATALPVFPQKPAPKPPTFQVLKVSPETPQLCKRRGPRPSTYSCTKCSQVFPYKKELLIHRQQEHARRHRAEFSVRQLPLVSPAVPFMENFICTEGGCEESFQTKLGLAVHVAARHSASRC